MVKKILAIGGGGMYGVVAAQAYIQIEQAMRGTKLKDIILSLPLDCWLMDVHWLNGQWLIFQ